MNSNAVSAPNTISLWCLCKQTIAQYELQFTHLPCYEAVDVILAAVFHYLRKSEGLIETSSLYIFNDGSTTFCRLILKMYLD